MSLNNRCYNSDCAGAAWVERDNKPLFECAACRFPKYCSKGCQRAHWKEEHKKMCPLIARVNREAKKSLVMALVRGKPGVSLEAVEAEIRDEEDTRRLTTARRKRQCMERLAVHIANEDSFFATILKPIVEYALLCSVRVAPRNEGEVPWHSLSTYDHSRGFIGCEATAIPNITRTGSGSDDENAQRSTHGKWWKEEEVIVRCIPGRTPTEEEIRTVVNLALSDLHNGTGNLRCPIGMIVPMIEHGTDNWDCNCCHVFVRIVPLLRLVMTQEEIQDHVRSLPLHAPCLLTEAAESSTTQALHIRVFL